MPHKPACAVAFLLMVGTAAAAHRFSGTWEGTENGLPAVELTIQDAGGKITGFIGFFFQTRGADGKWHLGEKYTVPLLSPKLQGRVLTFETIHHKKHGSPELGPNNRYRVEFASPKEARLQIIGHESGGGGPGLKLTRRD